ncbi:hypothetical protein H0H92_001234, partial [Tricholoma furcatifolium]
CIWVPVQTISVTTGVQYGATLYYKVDHLSEVDVEVCLSAKSSLEETIPFDIQSVSTLDSELPGGWFRLSIEFSIPVGQDEDTKQGGAVGLIIAIVSEDAARDFDIKVWLGQLNVYPIAPPSSAAYTPMMLWADFSSPSSKDTPGTLSWEVAASFPPLPAMTIKSPDDPTSAWTVQPSNSWFPQF